MPDDNSYYLYWYYDETNTLYVSKVESTIPLGMRGVNIFGTMDRFNVCRLLERDDEKALEICIKHFEEENEKLSEEIDRNIDRIDSCRKKGVVEEVE